MRKLTHVQTRRASGAALCHRRALLIIGGAFLGSMSARAEGSWPIRPVRYINPFPAGGPTDTLSRIVCQHLTEMTGQQFVVENKSGMGGNIGVDAIAKSSPDGYTIGLFTQASHAIAPTLYSKLPFDPEKDFTVIGLLYQVPYVLLARNDFPGKTVPELIAMAKAKPGKYTYGSAGAGTTPHLIGELFKQRAGIDIMHVPYRGGAPATQDLLAGQVDLMFDNVAGHLARIRAKKLQCLGVATLERMLAAPEIPTIAEYLPGFDMPGWGGICGPAGLPSAMIEKASGLISNAAQTESLKTAYSNLGAKAVWKNPADALAFVRNDAQRLAPIIKASGAKVD